MADMFNVKNACIIVNCINDAVISGTPFVVAAPLCMKWERCDGIKMFDQPSSAVNRQIAY